MSKRTLAEDPTGFRIDYSRIANLLHLQSQEKPPTAAERPNEIAEPDPDEIAAPGLGEIAEKAIAVARREVTPEQRNRCLREGAIPEQAAELVGRAARQLTLFGHRGVHQQPPWHVRVQQRRRGRERLLLTRFLDRLLEPASVVLYFSGLVAERKNPDVPPEPPDSAAPPDRTKAPAAPGEGPARAREEWLRQYLAFLRAESAPRIVPIHGPLGRLDLRRPPQPASPNYRVRYNLACLFSRLAASEAGGDDGVQKSYLAEAKRQLRQSLAAVRGRQRRAIVAWAEKDPGLEGLRERALKEFQEIVADDDA